MKKRCCDAESEAWQWFEDAAALPAEWDDVLPEGHFLKRESLRIHQETKLANVGYRYLLPEENGVQVRAAFQVLSLVQAHVNEAGMKGWQRLAWRVFAGLKKPKLLVAGHLFRHDVASLYYSGEDFAAFRLYQRALQQAARESGAMAVLVKDVPGALVPYFQHYAPEYLLLRNDISMELELRPEWATLKDYEKSLKHKYAQRLRKVRQAFDGISIKALSPAEVAGHATDLHRLYRQVSDHQPVRLGGLSEHFLPLLKSNYPDELRIWAFFEQEKMVAFASAWLRAEAFDMFYIGFDYARNADLQLYFNLLFFSVEQAIGARKQKLILGRTALEAKARAGCRPRYLHTFLFIRNSLLRRIVAASQQRFLSMEGEWENRHPFK